MIPGTAELIERAAESTNAGIDGGA